MYKEALIRLIQEAANNFFQGKTDYKLSCAYKVELEPDSSLISFKAYIMAADKEPKYGEFFIVSGYLSDTIVCTEIKNKFTEKRVYDWRVDK